MHENGNEDKKTKQKNTKKYHYIKKIKNLYTLHVFIKVTESVRILDSSWI